MGLTRRTKGETAVLSRRRPWVVPGLMKPAKENDMCDNCPHVAKCPGLCNFGNDLRMCPLELPDFTVASDGRVVEVTDHDQYEGWLVDMAAEESAQRSIWADE